VQVTSGSNSYQINNLEFVDAKSCQAFEPSPGVYLITRVDRFADIFIDTSNKQAMGRSIAGLIRSEFSQSIYQPPPPVPKLAKATSRGLPDPIVHYGITTQAGKTLTGKGVTIAVLDSGLDVFHPDFITYDAAGVPTSRVLYFWDTLSHARTSGKFGSHPIVPDPKGDVTDPKGKAPGRYRRVTFPNGDPIGIVYNRDEITAALRTPRGQSPRILDWDTFGHGTCCAGIAAGNGNGGGGHQYAGVAPEADIIAVRLSSSDTQFESGFLFGMVCEWLESVAGDGPMVISCSWGGQDGGHDGETVGERQLNARFPTNRAGRAICVAAGNEAGIDMHAGCSVGDPASPGHLQWQTNVRNAVLNLYAQTDNLKEVVVTPDKGTTFTKGQSSEVNPLTKQVHVAVQLSSGPGGLSITSPSGTKYSVDAYLPPNQAGFLPGVATDEKIVGTPATAANAIAVGSYDWGDQFNLQNHVVTLAQGPTGLGWMIGNAPPASAMKIGQLSYYSNPGYCRLTPDKAVKPEIVAPGEWYTAAATANVTWLWWRDSTGFYQLMNGTSSACPYTAGVVALLLQKNPKLSTDDIKELFRTCATQDPFTGNVPNPKWGYGKLNFDAVQRMVDGKPARN
jgi:subtilisin family serine protease